MEKAQKSKKNIISETINKIIPQRKPNWTILVWWPLKVDSRITSRHQIAIQQITKNRPEKRTISPLLKECIYKAAPVAVIKQLKAVTRGQGLGSTKW